MKHQIFKQLLLAVFCLQLSSLLHVRSSPTTVDLDEQVQWLGRFQQKDGSYRADWPFSGFRLHVAPIDITAPVELIVTFGDDGCDSSCGYYMETIIDCVVTGKHYITANSTLTINLHEALTFQLNKKQNEEGIIHQIELRKVTEVAYADANGIMQILKIDLDNLNPLLPHDITLISQEYCTKHAAKPYKLLVIGDSVSAAYGVDGEYPCSFTADLENVHHGYATIVAEEINAEVHVIAWSGKGVVRNYGDENQVSSDPMPVFYNRTLGNEGVPLDNSDSNLWNPNNFLPDIILVMLGSNDYSTQPNPTDEQFTTGLVDFLSVIQEDYSYASAIAAACSPSAHGNQCKNIQSAAEQVGAEYIFVDPDCYNGGYGCDNHPNTVSQQFIADVIAPALKNLLP